MSASPSPSHNSADDRRLAVSRLIDAPREKVFQAWTEHLPEWWGPHGMTTPVCEMDLRPGGRFRTLARDSQGTEFPFAGVFLEVTFPERIVFTDAYTEAWMPSEHAFLTAVITFEAQGNQTLYTGSALHWTVADREKHEAMGFHHGWGESLERLVAAVAGL